MSVVRLLQVSRISAAEFYAARYGAVDADPSVPEQKLSLNWVYPFSVSNHDTAKTIVPRES